MIIIHNIRDKADVNADATAENAELAALCSCEENRLVMSVVFVGRLNRSSVDFWLFRSVSSLPRAICTYSSVLSARLVACSIIRGTTAKPIMTNMAKKDSPTSVTPNLLDKFFFWSQSTTGSSKYAITNAIRNGNDASITGWINGL